MRVCTPALNSSCVAQCSLQPAAILQPAAVVAMAVERKTGRCSIWFCLNRQSSGCEEAQLWQVVVLVRFLGFLMPVSVMQSPRMTGLQLHFEKERYHVQIVFSASGTSKSSCSWRSASILCQCICLRCPGVHVQEAKERFR